MAYAGIDEPEDLLRLFKMRKGRIVDLETRETIRAFVPGKSYRIEDRFCGWCWLFS